MEYSSVGDAEDVVLGKGDFKQEVGAGTDLALGSRGLCEVIRCKWRWCSVM